MTRARSAVGDRRSPSRGERQRARIIEAVAELLAGTPIADLSVSRIAEHAGVTRPAFYFYFESRYAVVAAALEQVWAEVDIATAEMAGREFADPPAFNDRMIDSAVEVWHRHMPLLHACLQARQSDPHLRELWDRFIENLSGKLSAFIDVQRDAGSVMPACDDTAALTQALLGMTVWALHEQQVGSQSMSPERLTAAVRAVWLAAAWGQRSSPTSRP